MRIVKDADDRKNEILDIAQRLFHEKGYMQTTVEDIMKECRIAKGTLYYHFKSKEDILSAMIDRQIDRQEETLKCIAQDTSITAVEKLIRVIRLLSHKARVTNGLCEQENPQLHQKSFTRTLFRFTPAMTAIVEEGIKSGEFSTPYPRESVELLFCASQLHDPSVFQWMDEEYHRRKKAFFWMLELTLGISPDAKKQLYQLAGLPTEPEADRQ
ncbi:MAG: TetR/AcrR family transcriptional regulator [Clostridiales bacterium]|nr:TetR/AcrR family transcriptional regulator [Clostridiales bacterium]